MTDVTKTNLRTLKGYEDQRFEMRRIKTPLSSQKETTFSPSTLNVRQNNITRTSCSNDNKSKSNLITSPRTTREPRNLKQRRDRRKTLNSTLLNNLISATVKKAERFSHSARRNSGIGLEYIRQLSAKNTNLPNS